MQKSRCALIRRAAVLIICGKCDMWPTWIATIEGWLVSVGWFTVTARLLQSLRDVGDEHDDYDIRKMKTDYLSQHCEIFFFRDWHLHFFTLVTMTDGFVSRNTSPLYLRPHQNDGHFSCPLPHLTPHNSAACSSDRQTAKSVSAQLPCDWNNWATLMVVHHLSRQHYMTAPSSTIHHRIS